MENWRDMVPGRHYLIVVEAPSQAHCVHACSVMVFEGFVRCSAEERTRRIERIEFEHQLQDDRFLLYGKLMGYEPWDADSGEDEERAEKSAEELAESMFVFKFRDGNGNFHLFDPSPSTERRSYDLSPLRIGGVLLHTHALEMVSCGWSITLGDLRMEYSGAIPSMDRIRKRILDSHVRNLGARVIQRQWLKCRGDPSMTLCRRRLKREYDRMQNAA